MAKKLGASAEPRIAHFFRDVDLSGNSCPEIIQDSFPLNFQAEDDQWSAVFLLRLAVRLRHLWASYGVRGGKKTIQGPDPAVCFSEFNLSDLIAVRDGFTAHDSAVTQYAITFPMKQAVKGGMLPVVHRSNEGIHLQDGSRLESWQDDTTNQFRLIEDPRLESNGCAEWRWRYPGNYRRNIEKIDQSGVEGNTIPGLKLTLKKWSGLGIVVPDVATARALQYDIISLIDSGVITKEQFDYILVCDLLPKSLNGLNQEQVQAAFSSACFDFKYCMGVSVLEALVSTEDFSSRVLISESSTTRGPFYEGGSCWLWFQDNSHRYVRSLVRTGRVKISKKGRYLASLD